MAWHKLFDFREEHRIAADIAKGIAKKVGVNIEKVKGELYFTAENSYYKERSGLSSYDFFSQAVMEYRLLGTTGFTGYGKKIYVNKDYDIGIEGMEYDSDRGKYIQSDNSLGADFIELVSLKGEYIIKGEMIWGKNLGDKPKAPNKKTEAQMKKEKAEEQERQERLLALMQGAAAQAVAALSERQEKAAAAAFEEGMEAAAVQRKEHQQ